MRGTLSVHGNLPWQSNWQDVPRCYHGKVHRYAKYITQLNFEKYRQRDVNLTFHRLLEQTTRGYMGEMFFYHVYGQYNQFMMPDWYMTNEADWPRMSVSWSPDHTAPIPFGFSDSTIGFEDKTGRACDPGWALQWSSSDRRARKTANRMPLAYGAIGPNYFLVLLEHNQFNGVHTYRVAAIVRGLDFYQKRNFEYKGTPLLGPMANGNPHKRQITKEVLYQSNLTFFRPAWVSGPVIEKPIFCEEDFPAFARKGCLKKKGSMRKPKRVRFDTRSDKIHIIENCLCKPQMEDDFLEYLKKTGDSKLISLVHDMNAQAAWDLYLQNGDREEMDDTLRRIVNYKCKDTCNKPLWGDMSSEDESDGEWQVVRR